jgi:hypothetical protein
MAENNIMPWLGWALSAYGAALSTVLAILHWRRDKGRFSISPEILHIQIQLSGEKMVVWRLMEIVNTGRRPLYLDDFGIILTSGTLESMRERERETEFPLKLEEGQKHRSMTVEDKFASHEIKKLWAKDTTGKMYYSGSNPFGKE